MLDRRRWRRHPDWRSRRRHPDRRRRRRLDILRWRRCRCQRRCRVRPGLRQDTGGATLNLGAGQIEEATGGAGADVLDASSATWSVALRRRRHPDRRAGTLLIGGRRRCGDDWIFIDGADAVVSGGAGFDRVVRQRRRRRDREPRRRSRSRRLYGDAGADVLDASGATWSVALAGDAGADILIGGAGDDWIYSMAPMPLSAAAAGMTRSSSGRRRRDPQPRRRPDRGGHRRCRRGRAECLEYHVERDAGRRCRRRYPDWWHRCRFSLRQRR